jgi:hypothetical protein
MLEKILLHNNAILDSVNYHYYKDYFQLYRKYIQAIDEAIVLLVNEVVYLDQMICKNVRKNQ